MRVTGAAALTKRKRALIVDSFANRTHMLLLWLDVLANPSLTKDDSVSAWRSLCFHRMTRARLEAYLEMLQDATSIHMEGKPEISMQTGASCSAPLFGSPDAEQCYATAAQNFTSLAVVSNLGMSVPCGRIVEKTSTASGPYICTTQSSRQWLNIHAFA